MGQSVQQRSRAVPWSPMTPDAAKLPKYAEIAASIRGKIEAGDLGPGDRIPSEKDLADEHAVARPTAARAIALLRSEGWVTSSEREGSRVRARPALRVRAVSHYLRAKPGENTSPFARDAEREGKHPDWDHETVQLKADQRTAERLRIAVGDPVMRTAYVYKADGLPVQTAVSWEPYAVVGDTPIEFPEKPESQVETTGVVARMDLIGVHVDRVLERVRSREATAAERLTLNIPEGIWVVAIDRTQWAGDLAVEITDIVIPADRYALEYDIPILD